MLVACTFNICCLRKFKKDVGYKINIQKLVVFLYNNNEFPEKELKKTFLFMTALNTVNT